MITETLHKRGRKKKVIEPVETVTETTEVQEVMSDPNKPIELNKWTPAPNEIYFYKDNKGDVYANYESLIHMNHSQISRFIIIKKHYIERLDDILIHTNYFVNFYDVDKEFFMSLFSVKYLVDTRHQKMTQKAFKSLVMHRIITPTFISNIKRMVSDLYTINIDTDISGEYRSTPKITNKHAKVILAVSFAIRAILPLCIHFTNVSSTIVNKRDYIPFFDDVFMGIITAFEVNDTEIYGTICRFIEYRIIRKHNSDLPMWEKKKQVHGVSYESYLNELIHEVILVKSLYKIRYDSSVVSYFDGIIQKNYLQFKSENYKAKPVEVSSEEYTNDSDDFLTHAESLEMSMYRIDESNIIINDINIDFGLKDIQSRFNIEISEDEFRFYMDNLKINSLTQTLMHAFYSRYFKDSTAVQLLTKEQAVYLIVLLKKFLQLTGMTILPQIITATVQGRFKENIIKNYKFMEKCKTSAVYINVIENKFRFVREINPKEDPIIKLLSTIINSSFTWVDTDPEINGRTCEDITNDIIIDEFLYFLSII